MCTAQRSIFGLLLFFLLWLVPARAQGNYEVQVYGSEMTPPGRTMVELHSNFTFEGSKTAVDGVLPDNHALHETIEITQGITSWFETGFYIFMSYRADEGYQWVGDHIRPRVRVPEAWHWPVTSAFRPRSATSAAPILRIPGLGRSGRSSTSNWIAGTWHSIPRWTAPSMG